MDVFIPFFYDNAKKCFQNSRYIRENLPGKMELFELPILKSGDLNLKACAFKFLIVLLLCYNILFYFNLYISLAVTNGLCIYIITHQYWKVKKLKLCSYCIQITVDIANLSHLLSSLWISVYNLETKIWKIVGFFFLV